MEDFQPGLGVSIVAIDEGAVDVEEHCLERFHGRAFAPL